MKCSQDVQFVTLRFQYWNRDTRAVSKMLIQTFKRYIDLLCKRTLFQSNCWLYVSPTILDIIIVIEITVISNTNRQHISIKRWVHNVVVQDWLLPQPISSFQRNSSELISCILSRHHSLEMCRVPVLVYKTFIVLKNNDVFEYGQVVWKVTDSSDEFDQR